VRTIGPRVVHARVVEQWCAVGAQLRT
jgi:hypothetical protein